LAIGVDQLELLLPKDTPRRRLVVGAAPWGPVIVSGYRLVDCRQRAGFRYPDGREMPRRPEGIPALLAG
jgi:hypothetical protein